MILHGRDAILRVCAKWLIFNRILQLWADVKYHVPTGFDFSPKAVFYVFCFCAPSIYRLNPKNADAIALAFVGYFCELLCRVFI